MEKLVGGRRLPWRIAAFVFTATLFAAGAAVASVPQGNVISACRANSGGALRVIDRAAGQRCRTGESALDWKNLRWRGQWQPTIDYQQWDAVVLNGSSFLARRNPTVGQPTTNAHVWGMFAKRGAAGIQGLQGVAGDVGPQGDAGPQGAQGDAGPQGEKGDSGDVGTHGTSGDLGPQGETGPQGVQGDAGPQGVKGDTGDVGPQGETGPQGVQGDVGPQGVKGDTGDVGPQGLTGPAGSTGASGSTGATGATGAQGPGGNLVTRSGSGLAATKSGNTYTYTYATPLPAGSYAVSVMLHGAYDLGFGGNPTMPIMFVASSTTTGFSFSYVNFSNGAVMSLTSAPASVNIDFVVAQSNP